jgi:activating signal cointegrator complex subunit 1
MKGGYKPPTTNTSQTGINSASSSSQQPQTSSQANTKYQPPTHFLCLPLITTSSRPQLEVSLQRFRDETQARRNVGNREPGVHYPPTAEQAPAEGDLPSLHIPEKAIRPLGTLHLTLGVMRLEDRTSVEKAVKLLQEIDVNALLSLQDHHISPDAAITSIHDPPSGHPEAPSSSSSQSPPLTLSLSSLASIHPPQQTSILYAVPIDPTNRLQAFGEALRTQFIDEGLMTREDRPLKLHATIVNTIYAKRAGGARRGAKFIKFDSTALIEHFREFEWASEVRIERVAICKMGAKKIVGVKGDVVGEEYEEVGCVELPGG